MTGEPTHDETDGAVGSILERATMEHALLLFFLVVAGFMFIESYSFTDRAAAFPRFTAGATIVGTLMLLFRSYLPGPLQRLVMDTGGSFDSVVDDELQEEIEESSPADEPRSTESNSGQTESAQATGAESAAETDDDDDEAPTFETRYIDVGSYSIHGTQFLAIATVGFVAVAYLIGMVWAAPLFVAGYLVSVRRPPIAIIVLSAIAFVAAVAFYEVLNIPVADGALIDLSEPLDLAIENARIVIWLITENIRQVIRLLLEALPLQAGELP